MKAKSKADGFCGICNGEVPSHNLNLFYCSEKCRKKAWNHFHPDEEKLSVDPMIYVVVETVNCMDGEYDRPVFASISEEIANQMVEKLITHRNDSKRYRFDVVEIHSDPETALYLL